MSLLTEPFNPRYLEALEQLRLIDDTFFDAHMDGEYRGNDDMGLLMHDFFCADLAKMHFPELAKRADFLKHNNKGVKSMCEIMQKLQDEGHTEERYSTAKRMLLFNEPIEKIVAYTSLSEECIKELAQQTH